MAVTRQISSAGNGINAFLAAEGKGSQKESQTAPPVVTVVRWLSLTCSFPTFNSFGSLIWRPM